MWARFLISIAGPMAKEILLKLGIGIVTYTGIKESLDFLIDSAKGSFLGIDSGILQLLSIGGISTALGIISGAMAARVAQSTVKKFILK